MYSCLKKKKFFGNNSAHEMGPLLSRLNRFITCTVDGDMSFFYAYQYFLVIFNYNIYNIRRLFVTLNRSRSKYID